MTGQPEVQVGDVVRQSKLGSTATYVVLGIDGPRIEVEVVEAPGLKPGSRFMLAAEAVGTMEQVNAKPKAASAPAGQRSWSAQVSRPKPTS